MAVYPSQPAPPPTMGSSNTVFVTKLRFDASYIKTPLGILKIIVLVLNFIGYMCVQSSTFWSNGRGIYFSAVAHLGFWISGGLLLLYLFHAVEKYHNVKWLKIEMVASSVLVLLYLIASTIAVAFGSPHYSAGGFFGYLAMVTYGVNAFLLMRALRDGNLAQGTRVMNKQTHVVTPPALP